MGAVAVSGRVNEVFLKTPLLHLNTYAGHPVACAAALAALDVTEDEQLVENAAAMEAVLRDELEPHAPERAAHPRGDGDRPAVERDQRHLRRGRSRT